jgi:hypothetical protein
MYSTNAFNKWNKSTIKKQKIIVKSINNGI